MISDINISIRTNVEEFATWVMSFVRSFDNTNEQQVRLIGADLFTLINSRMPVVTGRARAGWKAAGDALGVEVPASDASQAGDSQYFEQGRGDNFSITAENNVPYVSFLEYGWSIQQPLGFVRISVAELMTDTRIPERYVRQVEELWRQIPPPSRYGTQREILGQLGIAA